ncbi:hypothetical protein [Actinoplanes sp. NPDC026619]|uniref:hypothetical protein n=1 Tax=Actinoplanes sp. NPDC026619 TaxID=3155798 RepID=UPI00340B9BF2
MSQVRVALVGHSGAGKSTFVAITRRYCEERQLTVARIGLAEPLYELQQAFRRVAGQDHDATRQDQVLLEVIAAQLRRLDPDALARVFLEKVRDSAADLVINDDLRDIDVDQPALIREGFALVRVVAPEELRNQRRRQRGDISSSDESSRHVEDMECRLSIENCSSLGKYESSVRDLLEQILDSER